MICRRLGSDEHVSRGGLRAFLSSESELKLPVWVVIRREMIGDMVGEDIHGR